MADTEAAGRPTSGLRGRATRRGGGTASSAAAAGDTETNGADEAVEEGEPASWKVELESIMSGTHPSLVEALEPHDEKMKHLVSQADRVRELQMVNINALFECEKKQADDESKVRGARGVDRSTSPCPPATARAILCRSTLDPACHPSLSAQAHLEFFKARLIDGIEEKQKKAAQQVGGRGRGTDAKGKAGGDKRKRSEPEKISCLPASYTLKPEELKADMEEINTNHDHYSVRSAAVASDELRASSSQDAWFDRSRQLLHCSGHSLERGSNVFVYLQGQRVDDAWTLTAMNAVEVTLRDQDGTKLKVTLAQLRNGRYVFRPTPSFM